jgi:NitT/TauT family transport system substrate-binding protein
MDRRIILKHIAAGLSAGLTATHSARAEDSAPIRINLPGPQSLPFLPLELIPRLGFDRVAGSPLQLRYFASGVLALEDMLAGNAHFSAHGFSVLPGMHQKGKYAVAVARLSGQQAPAALLARVGLPSKPTRVSDLASLSIGVSSGTVSSKTYLQMLGEQILKVNGVATGAVRWVPMAQNWESVKGALVSKSIDAILSEEPFATRAINAGLARPLFRMNNPKDLAQLPGSGHLRAVVTTATANMVALAESGTRLLRMIGQSLDYIKHHTPTEIVDLLGVSDASGRREWVAIIGQYKGLFPSDPRFSTAALQSTAVFLHAIGAMASPDPSGLAILIDDRWTGHGE